MPCKPNSKPLFFFEISLPFELTTLIPSATLGFLCRYDDLYRSGIPHPFPKVTSRNEGCRAPKASTLSWSEGHFGIGRPSLGGSASFNFFHRRDINYEFKFVKFKRITAVNLLKNFKF